MTGPKRKPLLERFEAKYQPVPEVGCWVWIAGLLKGYGSINAGGRNGARLLAHRVSYELHIGPIPEGMQVLHKCDTASCVNPNHLFLGTHQDNMTDKVKKGRQHRPQWSGARRGKNNPNWRHGRYSK